MKIQNLLPILVDCLRKWEQPPTQDELQDHYVSKIETWIAPMLEDWDLSGKDALSEAISDLDWPAYRAEALKIDPAREEARCLRHLRAVEKAVGLELAGEAVLFGAFTLMDGYARFDKGVHRVFLGVDESHGRGAYMDILMAHELTHVARETRPEMWAGHGLPSDLSHDDFSDKLPVIEHLFNEGFSCAISELVHPCDEPWHYSYQSRDSLAEVLEHGPAVDRVVHEVIQAGGTTWGQLYSPRRYRPKMPMYCHYVWAWAWVRTLIAKNGGDPRKILSRSSSEFVEDALAFRLTAASIR